MCGWTFTSWETVGTVGLSSKEMAEVGHTLLQIPDFLVSGRFKVLRVVGEGAGGIVFEALDIPRGDKVAIKVECQINTALLWKESQVYRALLGQVDVPVFRYYGTEKIIRKEMVYKINVLVLDLKGPNLKTLFEVSPEAFTLKRILHLAIQMISRLECLHQKGYIHRDVKPGNFVMGTGAKCNTVYLIDFGLAKKYLTPSGRHVPYKENRAIVGTYQYMSLNVHQGRRKGRRDDLISIGYSLMWFLRKGLPWTEHCPMDAEAILRVKMETGIDKLCEGYPKEFGDYLNYCYELNFTEEPDYAFLKGLFLDLYKKMGFDGELEWNGQILKRFPELQCVENKAGNLQRAEKFPNEFVVNGRYHLKRTIGSGAYGKVIAARDTVNGDHVAIKFEKAEATHVESLANEREIYIELNGGVGVPRIRYFGTEGNQKVLVMDLLGPSLRNLFAMQDGSFSLKTVLMIADQLLERVEWIHGKGFIHQDIKPDNCVIGTGRESNTVFLIDLSLSNKYRLENGRHIPCTKGATAAGCTIRYASINVHIGYQPSRRDDLESLGYSLVEMLRGSLPWAGLGQGPVAVGRFKMKMALETLCQDLPKEFLEYPGLTNHGLESPIPNPGLVIKLIT